MGKVSDYLQKQLTTDKRKDAEDCIKIYNKLKELCNGHVWDTEWRVLVNVSYKGFPSSERTYRPSSIGYVFLKGITD